MCEKALSGDGNDGDESAVVFVVLPPFFSQPLPSVSDNRISKPRARSRHDCLRSKQAAKNHAKADFSPRPPISPPPATRAEGEKCAICYLF